MTSLKNFAHAVLVILFVLLPVLCLADGEPWDSWVLAVQHFDPGHQIGLKRDSQEVQFIEQALKSAREEVPELFNIHVRVNDGYDHDHLRPFQTYSIKQPGRTYSIKPDSILIKNFEDLLSGCRRKINIEIGEGVKNRFHVFTHTRWRLCESFSRAEPDTHCNTPDLVSPLCEMGVTGVHRLRRTTRRGRQFEMFFIIHRPEPIDPEFIAKRLEEAPFFKDHFPGCTVEPLRPVLVGDRPNVQLADSQKHSGFEGVSFVFKYGWGDCPSGCLHNHYWEVTVRPKQGRGGRGLISEVEQVVEYGDELPEKTRNQLRCR
jgi:hypothetical protein